MGKGQSKEDNRVVIAQNSTQVEEHITMQSTFMLAIISLLVLMVVYVIWRRFCNRIKAWLRKQISASASAPTTTPLTHVRVVQPVAAPAAVMNPAPAAANVTYG